MRPRVRWILSGVLAFGLATLALPAGADHNQDSHKRMFEEFTSPNGRTNSDFAFWGDHAFSGYYSGSDATPDGGVRIFDISNPAAPSLIRDFKCDGLQADPIVWDRNGNGVADLLMLAVDRTMLAPECGAPRTAHNDPNGWEGVRVFTMSDDPANPFTTITQVKAVYTDCGAHTITAWPKDDGSGLALASRGVRDPAAIACHDIVVHVEHRLAGAACAEQGQVWEIDENGIPDTQDPIMVGDDAFSSGGTGDIPGAIDFFHSVMFDNDATVVNWVDESFGSGCPTMTQWQARPWHPASLEKTGSMFFSDLASGDFLSQFHVGDLRPSSAAGEYCSAHMGMAVMGIRRDLLVNAWYTGGVDVIDFTQPSQLKEIAYYDPAQNSGTWSAYPYTGPLFKTGPGIPVYASDGVENNALAEGMVVYRTIIEKPGKGHLVDHLNPQTMDHMP